MRWLIGLFVLAVPALAAASSSGAVQFAAIPIVALAVVGGAMIASGVVASVKGAVSGYDASGQPVYNAGEGGSMQLGGAAGTDQWQGRQGDVMGVDAYRQQQNQDAHIQMLQDQAAGRGPSIAQDVLRRGQEQAMGQQRSVAASATGANRALAERTAAMNMGQMQQTTASDSAMLRAQEMLAARGQLGETLIGVRGQDIGVAGQNLGAGMQQRGLNDAMTQAQLQADTEREKLRQEAALEAERMKAESENAKASRWTQLGGALITGGGRMLGAAGDGG